VSSQDDKSQTFISVKIGFTIVKGDRIYRSGRNLMADKWLPTTGQICVVMRGCVIPIAVTFGDEVHMMGLFYRAKFDPDLRREKGWVHKCPSVGQNSGISTDFRLPPLPFLFPSPQPLSYSPSFLVSFPIFFPERGWDSMVCCQFCSGLALLAVSGSSCAVNQQQASNIMILTS